MTDKNEYLTIEETLAQLINQGFIVGNVTLNEMLNAQCHELEEAIEKARVEGEPIKEIQRLENLLEILELKIKLADLYETAIENELARKNSSLILDESGLRPVIKKSSIKNWLNEVLISHLSDFIDSSKIRPYKYRTEGLKIIDEVILQFYENKTPPKHEFITKWIMENYKYPQKTSAQICRILSPDK